MSVIIYASEQGTAKGIAEQIAKETSFPVRDAKDTKPEEFANFEKIIFVPATYGRGDPPAEYRDWFAEFNAWTGDLSKAKFAVFGVGSANYKRSFVGFAKKIETKLAALGASKICDMGVCDETEEKSTDMNEFIVKIK